MAFYKSLRERMDESAFGDAVWDDIKPLKQDRSSKNMLSQKAEKRDIYASERAFIRRKISSGVSQKELRESVGMFSNKSKKKLWRKRD